MTCFVASRVAVFRTVMGRVYCEDGDKPVPGTCGNWDDFLSSCSSLL